MPKADKFEMIIKTECPKFRSGKEKHRYIKAIITEADRQFNKHTRDLGDWPLAIQAFEDETETGLLVLRFAKVLEPDENPGQTMNAIEAYLKNALQLNICGVERS